MTTLCSFRFLTGLAMVSAVTALCIVPACTVDSGSGDEEGGAGGEGTTGGTTSTGGTSSGGSGASSGAGEGGAVTNEGGAPAGGAGGESGGGVPSEGGSGGAGGNGGAGENGGASGKVCMDPATGETSAKGQNCSDYCSAYLSTCATYNTSDNTFADEAECLSTCELFGDAQLCCRAYHVIEAATNANTHCPHAAGNSVCN